MEKRDDETCLGKVEGAHQDSEGSVCIACSFYGFKVPERFLTMPWKTVGSTWHCDEWIIFVISVLDIFLEDTFDWFDWPVVYDRTYIFLGDHMQGVIESERVSQGCDWLDSLLRLFNASNHIIGRRLSASFKLVFKVQVEVTLKLFWSPKLVRAPMLSLKYRRSPFHASMRAFLQASRCSTSCGLGHISVLR